MRARWIWAGVVASALLGGGCLQLVGLDFDPGSSGGAAGHGGVAGHGGGSCDGPEDCPTGNECLAPTCDPVTGQCGSEPVPAGTPVAAQNTGDCRKIVCDGAGQTTTQDDDDDVLDDGNDCTVDLCTAGVPSSVPAEPGEPCDDGGGTLCDGGRVCVQCLGDADCQDPTKPKCTANACYPAECTDETTNGGETDKDCGGPCAPCEDGLGCVIPADCKSSVCTGEVCQTPSCGDGVKNGPEADADCGYVCPTKCTVGQSCFQGLDCVTGVCDPAVQKCVEKATGAPCISAAECASGHCVDDICCDTACDGVCEACSAPKKGGGLDGVCKPVADATDPDNDCSEEPVTTCQQTGFCKAGACAKYPAGTTCQPAGCSGPSTLSQPAVCDGLGACQPPVQVDCTPYACAFDACKALCASNGDCASTAYCAVSACVPKKPLGQACASSAECGSGNCADGVCCNSACSGVCQACNLSGKVGTCSPRPDNTPDPDTCSLPIALCSEGTCKYYLGQNCITSSQCASDNCVDGYCCNAPCAGTCEACNINVNGALGTCAYIAAGFDPDNECSGATPNCNGAGTCGP